LGLCPRSQWGSSQRSSDPLAGKGEGKGREGEGRRREGRGRRGRIGKGREGKLPPLKFKSGYALGHVIHNLRLCLFVNCWLLRLVISDAR